MVKFSNAIKPLEQIASSAINHFKKDPVTQPLRWKYGVICSWTGNYGLFYG